MRARIRILLVAALVLPLAPLGFADGVVIYSAIPNPLPPNVPSLGYEATSTSEFGELIQFAGGGSSYNLRSATVLMSDWTYESEWASDINGTTITNAGFYEPITLNLYNVSAGNTVGSLIASETVDAFIPWRPESGGCADPAAYLASDGNCYHGSLSEVSFDLTGVNVPGEIIYGLAYNTTDYGADPTGVPGPYDSLNLALPTTGNSVGSNPLPDTAYASSGAGGFQQEPGWTPYESGIEFTATPEPSSLLLLVSGLGALAVRFRRARNSSC